MSTNNSVDQKYSRYVWGGSTEYDGGRSLGWWERVNLAYDPTDQEYVIEKKYEKLGYAKLAAVVYGNSAFGILLLQFNNIVDPVSEFTAGRTILLPKPERVISYVSMGEPGGVQPAR